MPRLFPSLCAADQHDLEKTIHLLEPWCDGFHLDIMDNRYVPNMWGSVDLVNKIAQETSKPLWVHLMIEDPKRFITKLSLRPGDIITIHSENNPSYEEALHSIATKNIIPSIAINPSTSITSIAPALSVAKHAVIMSVEPGFSGQTFIPNALNTIKLLFKFLKSHNLNVTVGVDGGINKKNVGAVMAEGVNDIVVGNGIFAKKNPVIACRTLYQLIHHSKSE